MPRKGSKRRKTRTHIKPAANAAPAAPGAAGAQKTPKSFVVSSGTVGGTVAQLTKDVRRVLEPNTASRLRERKANRLRDYVSMSGPLGVTHLLVMSQPPTSTLPTPSVVEKPARAGETAEDRAERSLLEGTTTVNLRLIRLPRGPTLNFKVLRYSLAADVLRMARRPRAVGREFAEAPLLILSGFGGEDKQLKLMTTVFQNLFPPIHVQTMALSSARRVVLLSYNATTHTIDFRHYVIQVRPVGVSKSVRKIIAGSTNNKALPAASRKRPLEGGTSEESEASDAEHNDRALVPRPVPTKARGAVSKAKGILDLSRADDISDYILRQEQMGFVTSDSEISDMSDGGESAGTGGGASDSEQDEKKGKVRLAGDYVGRGNRGKGVRGDKRAVRLVELGPRMELGLVKIEEGVGEGEVLFHEMIHKTNREAAELAKVHAARRKLAAERRAQQEANVAAKKAAAGKGKGAAEDDEEEDDDDEEENPELVPAVGDDVAIATYEREHGLPPVSDEELFDDQGDEYDYSDDDEDAEMAPDSDAEDSHSEEEEEDGEGDAPWGDDDDSDTSPIPLSQAYQLSDDEEDDDDLPPPKKSAPPPKKKARVGPASFSSKQFKRIDKDQIRQAKTPIGIALPRPATKKEKKRQEEAEKKRNGGKKLENSAKPEEGKGGDRERGDRGSGGRGGRGGGRGGRGGGGRGGRGRGK